MIEHEGELLALRSENARLRTQLTDELRQRDAAVLVRNALNIATDRLEAERDEAMRERDAWIETAQIESENKEFYRGLVIKIGEPFGPPAYTSDDGSVQQDVLALKVPELVSALKSERDNAVAQVAVCKGALEHITYASHPKDVAEEALFSIGQMKVPTDEK